MNSVKIKILIAVIALALGVLLVLGLQSRGLFVLAASAKQTETAVAAPVAQQIFYHCPMHPQIIRDKPGTCPLCGMDLVPIEPGNSGDSSNGTLPVHAVHVDARMVQSLGVRTAVVGESPLFRTIRMNGTIEMEPQRVALVNSRVMGWIEKLLVGAPGLRVYKGQNLALLYSPDLVAAQEDYLQAMRLTDRALQASARRRLEVLGLDSTLIDSIRAGGKSWMQIPVRAPISGYVLDKYVVLGQNVMAGTDLYRIADLSSVWVVGQAYPQDWNLLRVGQEADVVIQDHSAFSRTGLISWIAPVVDAATQSAEVRVTLRNTADMAFKPGQNADLRVQLDLGTGIAVPGQSVIRTGERTVAVLALGGGHYIPRDVVLGAELGDSVQVLSGLAPGDSVVLSAQFLIDAESNLKKALQSYGE